MILRMVVFFYSPMFLLLPVLPLEIHVDVFSRVHSIFSNCIMIAWPTNVLANSTAVRWIFVFHVCSLFERLSWISIFWIFAVLFDFETLTILMCYFTCVWRSCRLQCTFNANWNPTIQRASQSGWWSNEANDEVAKNTKKQITKTKTATVNERKKNVKW